MISLSFFRPKRRLAVRRGDKTGERHGSKSRDKGRDRCFLLQALQRLQQPSVAIRACNLRRSSRGYRHDDIQDEEEHSTLKARNKLT